jgi:hypothetical protein
VGENISKLQKIPKLHQLELIDFQVETSSYYSSCCQECWKKSLPPPGGEEYWPMSIGGNYEKGEEKKEKI